MNDPFRSYEDTQSVFDVIKEEFFPMTDYDMSIHTNPDAMAWAKFFVETTKNMDRDAFRDESYMVGWFANAMMTMHDYVTGTKTIVLDDGSAFVVDK